MLDLVDKHSNTDTLKNVTTYWTQISRNRLNECTYCKTRNLLYFGHIHINCNVLKKKQKKRNKELTTYEKNKRFYTTKEAINNNNSLFEDSEVFAATIFFTDDSYFSKFILLTAKHFTHTTLSSILTANNINYMFKLSNDNEKTDINANATHLDSKFCNNSTNQWIFDTGCFAHMSNFAFNFINIKPFSSWVHVAGSNHYCVMGQSSIMLHTMLLCGDVIISILEDTFYMLEMPNIHFFSWFQVCHKEFHL